MGFRTITAPSTTTRTGWTSGSPRLRAKDLNSAFAEPSVDGIITTIGGNHSAQLLPHLDWATIAANPKVFCGYSAPAWHQTFHRRDRFS